MLPKNKIQDISFTIWLKKDKENRRCLYIGLLILIIQFIMFKVFYPFPNFMPPDSDNYVESAWNNDFISTWPIGYSKFLRLISAFSNSHFLLVTCQYVLLQASLFYFLFTIRFLVLPGKWLFRALLFINILNPLIPHICNFVSSDSIFAAISMIWLTQLFWIQLKPTKFLLITHGLILLVALMTRYYALYYPIISIPVVLTSPLSVRKKLINITYILLLISAFVSKTGNEYYNLTGRIQFSAFGGWQIAANALYGYAYSSTDRVEDIPPRFRRLHSITNHQMDSLRQLKTRPDNEVWIYYLWNFKSPLRIYMNKYFSQKNEGDLPFFKQWATVAPFYASYGRYLIIKHPIPFIKHYLWPNLIKYYAPPVKFMGSYNMEKDSVNPAIQGWFGWKSNKLTTYFKDKNIAVTQYISIVFAVTNLVFAAGLIAISILRKIWPINYKSKLLLLITFFVWLINMIFSVFSAPIELRYQIFPMVFTFSFACLIVSTILEATKNKAESSSSEIQIDSKKIIHCS